ncbi:MAG: hypothetical protein DRI39_08105 [Chloroflexi bacterium]|nr:MAG: hypothetical protein DRI39_08105 [Chloroflexota bacterium]RLC92858.1 MAG: hypothetical protein DRI40_09495 [Chloroflexota bacterium]
MEELKDYSGEFRPNIRYEDFSKDVLARLLKAYCKELLLLDAYWQQEVENRLGSDAAFECTLANWTRIGKYEMKWAMEALNITGNDVAAYVKTCQMIASFAQDVFDYDFDLKSNNHAVLTVRHCPALVSLEKNAPEKIVPTCQVLEEEAMKAYTRAVNPAIQVRGLKVPPRKSRDEIACQWEFKIDQG